MHCFLCPRVFFVSCVFRLAASELKFVLFSFRSSETANRRPSNPSDGPWGQKRRASADKGKPPCTAPLVACVTLPQAQNEAEIARLNVVIERLRQSIEELAAAAQVADVHQACVT
jgi:hypothetical protein